MRKIVALVLILLMLTGCRPYRAGEAGVEVQGQIDELADGFEKLEDVAVEYPK